MICKVYQMYKKINGEDAVEREVKNCRTEYDDNGNYIISHCVW